MLLCKAIKSNVLTVGKENYFSVNNELESFHRSSQFHFAVY